MNTPLSMREQIKAVERQLANARARIPKHTIPPALMREIDELEEELADLRSQVKEPLSLEEQIQEVKQQLTNARTRMPPHDIPAALMGEIDELEERLAELQTLRDKA
jgi:peptidoglycan hydrolase CwlO-like protein